MLDAEFQVRKEKGHCFRCNEIYYHDHRCKNRGQRELRMYVVRANDEEFEIIEEVGENELFGNHIRRSCCHRTVN